MKCYLFSLSGLAMACLVGLSGCANRTPYPAPELSAPTARLWFSLDSDRTGPKVINFDHLPAGVQCQGASEEAQELAVISLGRPDVQTTGEGGVRVLTGSTLRVMAYAGSADSRCPALVAFTPAPKQEYRVQYQRRGEACTLSVRLLDDSSGRRIWQEEPTFEALECTQ